MLQTADVISGKIVVQLGFASAEEVRAELRALDTPGSSGRDLVNRITSMKNLDPKKIEVVRHGVARRAQLYFLRNRVGKAATLRERRPTR